MCLRITWDLVGTRGLAQQVWGGAKFLCVLQAPRGFWNCWFMHHTLNTKTKNALFLFPAAISYASSSADIKPTQTKTTHFGSTSFFFFFGLFFLCPFPLHQILASEKNQHLNMLCKDNDGSFALTIQFSSLLLLSHTCPLLLFDWVIKT